MLSSTSLRPAGLQSRAPGASPSAMKIARKSSSTSTLLPLRQIASSATRSVFASFFPFLQISNHSQSITRRFSTFSFEKGDEQRAVRCQLRGEERRQEKRRCFFFPRPRPLTKTPAPLLLLLLLYHHHQPPTKNSRSASGPGAFRRPLPLARTRVAPLRKQPQKVEELLVSSCPPAAASSSSSSSGAAPPPPPAPKQKGAKLIPLAASVGIGLALRFLVPIPTGLEPQAWTLLSVFVSTIAGLVLEPLPTGAWAAVAATAAVASGALTFAQAFSAFRNDVIWLIVVSFFFAAGFQKTGLGERVATLFVRAFGSSTLGLAYGLAAAEAVVAPAMPSTTARSGGIFLPIIDSLARAAGSLPGKS